MNKLQTLKGFRDFLPSEVKKRQYVIRRLSEVFESYGFEPLETPALEYEEILAGKYGDEGEKLMYKFTDNGGRKVALRYDQTVPLARVVAQYGTRLPNPFKRYQIQPVWRAEKPQKGRFREFVQCDIDTVGTTSLLADAEIISCTLDGARALGFANLVMQVNDRKIFEGVEQKFLVSLDKIEKIGKDKVFEELRIRGMKQGEAEKFLEKFETKKPTNAIREIFSYLEAMGLKEGEDFVFNPLIVRGLDYYTGSIFELVDRDDPSLSLAGGGRYDELIGVFARKKMPAVGIAFGFDRVVEAMQTNELFPRDVYSPVAKVLVTVFNKKLAPYSLEVAKILREKNISCEIYPRLSQRLERQLRYANNRDMSWVVILGPEEAKNKEVTLKDMDTNDQETVDVDQAVAKLKDS